MELDLIEIPGEPGFFVKRDGTVWTHWHGRGRGISYEDWSWSDELVACPICEMPKGYCQVRLTHERVLVHVLVLTVFVGPCPEGCQTRHKNGVRNDNRVDNLEWGTQSENENDKKRHGTFQEGSHNGHAFLTEDDIREIFKLHAAGWSINELNEAFDTKQVSRILQRKTWKHVEI